MSEIRTQQLAEIIEKKQFDAIVLGGGINGISVYRELALCGLSVLLVEREDFCSGCSAAPSRMIHGGLRYLENGELGLVRESLKERDALLLNAAHLVHPLPTMIPIYQTFSGIFNSLFKFLGLQQKPADRGALVIKIGLALYDLFTRKRRRLPKHSFFRRKKALSLWPLLNPNVQFTATYHDAWISHPERLGVEMIKDCEGTCPNAIALNYAQLEHNQNENYTLVDRMSGQKIPLQGRVLINATGAWLDKTNQQLLNAKPSRPPMVGGTKGSHLILANPQLYAALNGHMVYFENKDGRVCIVFPYLGNVLVGSTDIRVNQPGPVCCSAEEAKYILESLSYIFPTIKIKPADIVYTYSGIRPLPHSNASFTGNISRDHFTQRIAGEPLTGEPPVFCMVGGKWTTFRAFGEQTCDAVLKEFKMVRQHNSLKLPIGGGQGFPSTTPKRAQLVKTLGETFNITANRAEHALGLYGTQAQTVLAFCGLKADTALPDVHHTAREIIYLIRFEYAQKLSDVFLRRTPIAITGQITLRAIQAIGQLMQAELGWSAAEFNTAQTEFIAQLNQFHGLNVV